MDDAVDRAPSLLDAPPVIENPTDAELVEAGRAGDSFAVTRLWQRHLAVAWTAARAASGRPDAEPVVVRTAARLIAELGEGRGPSGATRPHLLALTRHAVADTLAPLPADGSVPTRDDVAGAGPALEPAPALELAPAETYRDLLPDGMENGATAAAAFSSLPTRWQESLWLTEVDGLDTAELAAELGLTADAAESMLTDARSALRTEWSAMRLAGLPDAAECRAAASGPQGRRVRAHLDDCAGCRVLAAPPATVSRRALATLPLLLLGAGAGVAFLESLRQGASAAATEPVPSLAEIAAATADSAGDPGAAGSPSIAAAPGGIIALPAALIASIRNAPQRRVAALGAALGGIAATTALVVSLAVWNGGGNDPSMFLADSGAAADTAEPAPQLLPPVVVATEVPRDPAPTSPPATPRETAPGTAPEPPAASDSAPAPGTGATGDATAGDAGARAGGGAPATGADAPAPVTPSPAPGSGDRPPLEAELGRPGSNGWRTLTVTGEPGSPFTVLSGGSVLFTGVLDSSGTSVLQVRGAGGDVGALTLSYGTVGDMIYALADDVLPSLESTRRTPTISPAPSP